MKNFNGSGLGQGNQYIDKAITREKQLKGWIRQKKIDLIKNSNPTMEELIYDNL